MASYSLKCKSCGGMMDLDLDNLTSYCPYCGEKILIDIGILKNIIEEKEKTRRLEIQEESKLKLMEKTSELKRKEDRDFTIRVLIGFSPIVLFVLILVLIAIASR